MLTVNSCASHCDSYWGRWLHPEVATLSGTEALTVRHVPMVSSCRLPHVEVQYAVDVAISTIQGHISIYAGTTLVTTQAHGHILLTGELLLLDVAYIRAKSITKNTDCICAMMMQSKRWSRMNSCFRIRRTTWPMWLADIGGARGCLTKPSSVSHLGVVKCRWKIQSVFQESFWVCKSMCIIFIHCWYCSCILKSTSAADTLSKTCGCLSYIC